MSAHDRSSVRDSGRNYPSHRTDAPIQLFCSARVANGGNADGSAASSSEDLPSGSSFVAAVNMAEYIDRFFVLRRSAARGATPGW